MEIVVAISYVRGGGKPGDCIRNKFPPSNSPTGYNADGLFSTTCTKYRVAAIQGDKYLNSHKPHLLVWKQVTRASVTTTLSPTLLISTNSRQYEIMMFSLRNFLILGLFTASNAAHIQRRDSWGGALSLGPTKSTIISAVTTLIPGDAPSSQAGELFLWPGMSNGTGDLVQTTLESWPDNSWCGATTGQWCVRASVFGSFGQIDGTAGVVSGTDQVKIDYTLESNQQTWTQ